MKAFLAALPSPFSTSQQAVIPSVEGALCVTRRVSICRRPTGEHVLIAVVPQPVIRGHLQTFRVAAAEISTTGRIVPLTIDVGPARLDHQGTLMSTAVGKAGPFASIVQYPCMFGHVVLDKVYVLVATKVERAAILPFGKSVYNVKGTAWIGLSRDRVPPPRISRKDQSRLDNFLGFNLDEGHYFSDDANMSTLFPYDTAEPISCYDPSTCDWSIHMRKPYTEAGVSDVCTVLIRGFARGVQLAASLNSATAAPNESFASSSSGGGYANRATIDLHVTMIGRQNRQNAGPRYFGRGLNENGQAGNDHVYEVVLWHYRDPPANTRIAFARHVYLRGTVPLHFKSKLSTSGIGEANIIIGSDVYDGSAAYLKRQLSLLTSFHAPSSDSRRSGAPDASSTPSRTPVNSPPPPPTAASAIGLRCVNLLKSVSSAGEDLLTHHFRTAVSVANDELREAHEAAEINFTTMDWLGVQKDFGTERAAEDLWRETLPYLDPDSVTCDECVDPHATATANHPLTAQAARLDDALYSAESSAAPATAPAATGRPTHTPLPAASAPLPTRHQRRFVRVNCADSLDRTNVACFFVLCQVIVKSVAALDINMQSIHVPKSAFAAAPADGSQSPRKSTNTSFARPATPPAQQQQPAAAADATPGSPREDFDMMNTVAQLRVTPPATDVMPSCYFKTYGDMVVGLPTGLMYALVDVFVANGDCVAQLFTSTGALHTSVMRKLVPGMKEAPNNGIISAQRRYENMFKDKKKRRVLETMLGVRLPFHFPSFQGAYAIMPLPNELWATALIILGIPADKGVTAEVIVSALQAHWVEIQAREGVEFATKRLHDMPVRVGADPSTFGKGEQVQQQQAQSAAAVSTHDESGPRAAQGTSAPQLAAEPDDVVDEGAEVDTAEHAQLDSLMAVAVLPSPNIVRELLLRGALPITFSDGSVDFASVHPYTYPVENHQDANEAPVGAVETVAGFATSLKSKMKRLMQ